MRKMQTLLVIGLACLLATGCIVVNSTTHNGNRGKAGATKSVKGKYAHAVFFKLKPEVTKEQTDELICDGYKLLSKVPSVRMVESGRPDKMSTRDIVAKDYDVALLVRFDDKKGYDAYEVHPTHKKYVAKHKDKFAGVTVYDFIAK